MSQWEEFLRAHITNTNDHDLFKLESLVEDSLILTKEGIEDRSRAAIIFQLLQESISFTSLEDEEELILLLSRCMVKIRALEEGDYNGINDLLDELFDDLNELSNDQLNFQNRPILIELLLKLALKDTKILQWFVIGLLNKLAMASLENREYLISSKHLPNLLLDYLSNFKQDTAQFTTIVSLLRSIKINSSTLKSLFKPLIQKDPYGSNYLSALSSLLTKDNDTFYHFNNSSIQFKLNSTETLSKYTLQLWIKVNNLDEDQTILDINNKVFLKIQSSKLQVFYKNVKIDTIESIQIQENQIYHLVLIHESKSLSGVKSRIRFYINAEYIQTLKCPFPVDTDPSFASLNINNELTATVGSDTSSFSLYNLLLVSDALSHEWLVLSYYLGNNYSNTFQDENLLKFLNYEGRSYFNLKLLDISKKTEIPFNLDELKLNVPKASVILNFNPYFLKTLDVSLSENFVVRSNNKNIEIKSIIKFFRSQDVSELFYSISPIKLLFEIIESSQDIESLFQATETMLILVNSNWKFIEVFETMNGYNLLSTILKVKKVGLRQNLTIEFLHLFLKYNGYDFDSPFNSVVINTSCYDNLVLDFQLWKPLSSKISKIKDNSKTKDLELLKFLIFQIDVFNHECRNSSFNILKLKKIKIVKRILNCLSQHYFPTEAGELIQNTLSILVKSNLTADIVKSMSSHIIYSLSEGIISHALVTLRVLGEVFLDPLVSNASYWKQLFASVSIKWILLLIQLSKSNKEITDMALSFIIKIFSVNTKSQDIFLKNNGLQILLGSLRDVKIDEVEINILIKGSFGHYQYDLNFDSLVKPLPTRGLDQLLFPSFHYLIIDILEWTVLNDIFKEDSHDKIIYLINFYLDFLQLGIDEIPDLEKNMKMDKTFFKRLCGFVILLTKSQNAAIYFDPSQRVIDILSGFIMTKIFNSSSSEVESYVTSILARPENDQRSVILSSVFLSLVIPKLLIHIKNFSPEFEVLLESGGLNFTNVAVFLNVLNYELLTFEWDLKDYFNYMSVLLDLLEAYRKLNKNQRNPHYVQLVKNVTQLLNSLLVVLKGSDSVEQQGNFLKILVFHQENLFVNNYLSNDGLGNLISYLLHITVVENNVEITSLSLNCFRIILMQRQQDISSICSSITFRCYSSLLNFLSNSITLGDEDIVSSLTSDNKLSTLLSSHLNSLASRLDKRLTRFSLTPVQDILTELSKSHDGSIKVKYERLDELIKLLKNDNQVLKSKILTNEGIGISRFLQDQHDSLQFFISAYNKMKVDFRNEIAAMFDLNLRNTTWILDSTEGIDRTRKILLPHWSLNNIDKINNVDDLPTKRRLSSIEPESERFRMESLSLNSFEMVDAEAIQDDPSTTYNDKNRKVLKSLHTGDQIVEIWNVSQVVGLEITEGILILGQTHLYLIENYYHNAADDEIVNISDVPESDRDPNVKLITGQPRPSNSQGSSDINSRIVQTWDLFELTSVTKRQFLLRDVALELFFSDGDSFLITSIKTRERDSIYSKLSNVATNSNIDDDLSKIFKETNSGNNHAKTNTNANSFTLRLANVFSSDFSLEATKKWQRGEISNFYYLMIINTLAGRTFNDLTQYPIFPWVIADYTSDELDLTDPKTFRDLSKPMGAQSPARAQQFKERFEALQSLNDEDSPPFHYGTHYSSAMIVTSFLIRLEPFIQSYLLLQGGKFDHADRLFYSIEKAWRSSSAENTTDVRELIPEFFFLPELLTNINNYDFGKLQDGSKISDVELPKWAKGDPKIFIAKNREALESPYVSEHLHEWIDLIFGVKQSGPLAVEAINVFNHLSYHGAIDLDSINNEDERRSITGIIHNFGQTPLQIFNKLHSSRLSEDGVELNEFNVSLDVEKLKTTPSMIYQTKFKSPIKFLQFKVHTDNVGDAFWRGYPALHLNGNLEIKPDEAQTPGTLIINRQTFERLHDDNITVSTLLTQDTFLTGSENGSIHIWKSTEVARGLRSELNFVNSLRLHTSAIKELKVSPAYNLLLSLDSEDQVFLWDLVNCRFIRTITTKADHIAIAYGSGLIVTSTGPEVTIYTINGEPIIAKDLGSEISCLNFANSRTVTSFKSPSYQISHVHWDHEAVLIVGFTSGEIKVFEFVNDSKWSLILLKELQFTDKDNNVTTKDITVVESYLKSYFDSEEDKKGKIEIIAGDYNGRVAVWR